MVPFPTAGRRLGPLLLTLFSICLSWDSQAGICGQPAQGAQSEASQRLQMDLDIVRTQYQLSSRGEINNSLFYARAGYCGVNTLMLLKHAVKNVPGFDLNSARVLVIEGSMMLRYPLVVNAASRPHNNADEFKHVFRSSRYIEANTTTWAYHYVLEYQGRIFDLDYARPLAPTHSEYFETMFRDGIQGHLTDRARSTYLVRAVPATEFLKVGRPERFRIRNLADSNTYYFFDFYQAHKGSVRSKFPEMHFSRFAPIGYFEGEPIYYYQGRLLNLWGESWSGDLIELVNPKERIFLRKGQWQNSKGQIFTF